MSNEKLVRKFLRILPKKFAHKVMVIEEAQDLTTMRVDELMANLTTFEMSFDDGEPKEEDDQEEKVSNFVAFTAQTEPPVGDSLHDNSEDEEEMTEEELLEDYKLLYTKWADELTMIYTKVDTEKGKLMKENEKLTKIVLDRDEEIENLNAQLKALNKGLKMMIQALIFLTKFW
ncbi:hypothetical protein LIER_14917 [Lithospermum erythrorhizon]|uniref:Gag-pol polyprotein n=1 Tax=Lithospermum erythrorhizon TaxID=34254 RepID=A0AAV3Q2G5_LITER